MTSDSRAEDATPREAEVPPADVPPVFDADGALSREYLLARGHCCGNGCRNCPWGFAPPRPPSDPAR